MKTQIKQILREGLIREERIKFDFQVPSDILEIQKVFKKNGYKLYIVGGAVRDALLGKIPKDFDLATDAVPDKVEEIMTEAGFRTLPTGKAFGVINVFTNQGEYEIATFREDIGSGRRPDAVSFTNIEGDVKRRDLTINALFYDIDTKEIVDLVGGVDDLKQGVVRTVGTPEDRFGEDRLRILRAIRFAGRFGSELDPATDAALQKDSSLEGISGERIRDEFIKGIISAKSIKKYMTMLDKYNLFDWIFPSLDVNKRVYSLLNGKEGDYIVLLARLLKNNDIDLLRRKLNILKYSADEIKTIVFLISLLKLDVDTAYLLKKMQQTAGVSDDQIRNFGANEGISSQLLDAFEEFRLSVSGLEAMEKFDLKPGPELGKAIQKMETANFEKIIKIDMNEDIRKMIDKVKNINEDVNSDINFVYQQHPELNNIGTPQQYSQYVKTIFPDSEVKDIVFHQTSYEFDEFKPYLGKLGLGVYFSQRKDLGNKKGRVISALVNIKNPVTDYDDVLVNNEFFTHKDVVLKDEVTQFIYEIIVRNVNNIHILGSKKDIEGFKSFIKNKLDFN